jgi:MFS family permease
VAKEVEILNQLSIRQKVKTVFLSSLGGGLEFYDFVIFAIFAKSISDCFFPASSEMAGLIKSYGVFAIGYLIRPFGGLLFSHFGDRYGRKKSFSFSISLMAISTLLMSMLPSYEQWGLWATFIFILFRLLQGISIGGEIPGAITFVSEHVPEKKGAACAIVLLFLNIGILIANGIHYGLSHLLSISDFNLYGWRIAFFAGGLLAFISLYMRRSLLETQSFLMEKKRHRMPSKVVFRSHRKNFIKVLR